MGSDLSKPINIWFNLSVGAFSCRLYGVVVDCSTLYIAYIYDMISLSKLQPVSLCICAGIPYT